MIKSWAVLVKPGPICSLLWWKSSQIGGWGSQLVLLDPPFFRSDTPDPSYLSRDIHDKTNKMSVRPPMTQISPGIRPVWAESSLSVWRNIGSHLDSSQTASWWDALSWCYSQPPPQPHPSTQHFNTDRSKAVLLLLLLTVTCSCCPYLYFGSPIMLVTYFSKFFGSWVGICLGKRCSFDLPRVPFVNCCQFMYLVISLLVLRAGCGIWLYQFLIVAHLFTFYLFISMTFSNPHFSVK